MPIGESECVVKFFAKDNTGEYSPVKPLDDDVLTSFISERFIPVFRESLITLRLLRWKQLPAEVRFKKKHRHQASIDRKKRKERRRRNNEQ